MNKVILSGNLGADPEIRHTASGTAVCNLRIATSERRKQAGEWVDHAEWHSLLLWERAAENAARFLKKGSKVLVEGRLQTSTWTDRDGLKRYKTEIVVERIEYLSRAPGESGESSGSSGGGGGNQAALEEVYDEDSYGEEIPF